MSTSAATISPAATILRDAAAAYATRYQRPVHRSPRSLLGFIEQAAGAGDATGALCYAAEAAGQKIPVEWVLWYDARTVRRSAEYLLALWDQRESHAACLAMLRRAAELADARER